MDSYSDAPLEEFSGFKPRLDVPAQWAGVRWCEATRVNFGEAIAEKTKNKI